MRGRICGLLLIVGLTQTTFAADRVEVGTVLSIDLAKGTITDVKRKEETGLLDVNTFTIRRNETVKIEIFQNLLLFAYEAKSSKADTAEYTATLEFAKQLQKLLALFPDKGTNLQRATIGGFDPEQFRKDVNKVLEFTDRMGQDLSASLGNAEQVATLKKDYNEADFDVRAKRIDEAYAAFTRIVLSCMEPGAAIATDRGASVLCDGPSDLDINVSYTTNWQVRQATASKLEAVKDEVKKASDNVAAATKALDETKNKSLIATRGGELDALSKTLENLKFHRDRLQAEVDKSIKDEAATVGALPSRATLASFANDMGSTYGKITQLVTALVAFSADVAGLGRPLLLATVPHSIKVDTEAIEIKASGKYDKVLDSATRKKRDAMLRKFTVVLTPHQPAHISLAPAFVLGFIRNPEFSAVKDGDTFKVQKKAEELNRYSAAVMVNITPNGWREPTFGGHFQLGVSPVKDSLGFFAGAGIKAQNLISFGAGLMLQQVRKLGAGLTMESRLTDPANLKIEKEFKRGLYLHVTVEIPK